MDFYDATTLMRLVQAVENDPYVSSGAGEALADKVREFIEDYLAAAERLCRSLEE